MLLFQRFLTTYEIVLRLFSLLFLYLTLFSHQTYPLSAILNYLHSFCQLFSIYSFVFFSFSCLSSLLSLLFFYTVVNISLSLFSLSPSLFLGYGLLTMVYPVLLLFSLDCIRLSLLFLHVS